MMGWDGSRSIDFSWSTMIARPYPMRRPYREERSPYPRRGPTWNNSPVGLKERGRYGWTNQRRGLPGSPSRRIAHRSGETSEDDQGRRASRDRNDRLPDASVQGPWPIPRVLRSVQASLQPLPRKQGGHGGTRG